MSKFRDIIGESLRRQALSTSPRATLEELDGALIPFHERELKKAESNMKKAEEKGDGAAHSEALNDKIKHLSILVKLYARKKSLLTQLLSQAHDEAKEKAQY